MNPAAILTSHDLIWQAAATSVGGLAGVQRPAQAPVHVLQTSLRAKITTWEKQLTSHKLKTFHGPFQQGEDELLQCLKSLKRAVGSPEEPGTCSRIDIVGNMRAIAEVLLKHLARRLHKNHDLDVKGHFGELWPNRVITELQTERDEKNCGNRRLVKAEGGFYHHEHAASPAWHVQGKTNIQRLVDNLSKLRCETNKVPREVHQPQLFRSRLLPTCWQAHHLASLSPEELENILSHENIDKLMGRLSLLFQKGSPKDPEEPRMLF